MENLSKEYKQKSYLPLQPLLFLFPIKIILKPLKKQLEIKKSLSKIVCLGSLGILLSIASDRSYPKTFEVFFSSLKKKMKLTLKPQTMVSVDFTP